jgi:hypothetical protein
MAGPGHQPELLWFGGGVKQRLRFRQRSVVVQGAGDEKLGGCDFSGLPDRL